MTGPAGPPEALRRARALVFVPGLDRPAAGAPGPGGDGRPGRGRAGEPVAASDGRGSWVPCRFLGAEAGDECLDPDGPATAEPRPDPPLTVAFAPVKGDRPEWVVQKLTELGVDRIALLATDRSVVRWEGPRADRAVERLMKVAREAAAQSRRVHLPEVVGPTTLGQLAAGAPELALAEPGGGPLGPSTTAVAVGPEGGWSAEELAAVPARVGLGPHVLRAETAALAAGVEMVALRWAGARSDGPR